MRILSEFRNELRRNLKGINNFYWDPEICSGEILIYAFAPVVYAIGVLEPVMESPIREILNRYPAV